MTLKNYLLRNSSISIP